ncbi:MAG: SPASM domain-containing protein [Clostridia bacterium]|nr:SPASM domain-containing protein [Clostridia bacterium]
MRRYDMRFKRVYIEITNVCNLKCNFCLPHHRENRFMTFEEFKLILNKIKPYTNYIYMHVKGEPLLHPDVDRFIEYAYNEGFLINLTTNATLLKNHLHITKYLRQINISLHATNSLEIVQVAKQIKDCIVCFRIWNIDKDLKNKELLEKEFNVQIPLQENFTLAENIFLSQKEEFAWPTLESTILCDKKYCYGLINQIAILVDGTVTPCCLDNEGDINLGNIFNNDFNEIITSERAIKIIEGFKENKACEELCKKCTF